MQTARQPPEDDNRQKLKHKSEITETTICFPASHLEGVVIYIVQARQPSMNVNYPQSITHDISMTKMLDILECKLKEGPKNMYMTNIKSLPLL